MDDHIQLEENVLQLHSVLEVYHTARCVGGSGDTSLERLVHFMGHIEGKVLIATMLRV